MKKNIMNLLPYLVLSIVFFFGNFSIQSGWAKFGDAFLQALDSTDALKQNTDYSPTIYRTAHIQPLVKDDKTNNITNYPPCQKGSFFTNEIPGTVYDMAVSQEANSTNFASTIYTIMLISAIEMFHTVIGTNKSSSSTPDGSSNGSSSSSGSSSSNDNKHETMKKVGKNTLIMMAALISLFAYWGILPYAEHQIKNDDPNINTSDGDIFKNIFSPFLDQFVIKLFTTGFDTEEEMKDNLPLEGTYIPSETLSNISSDISCNLTQAFLSKFLQIKTKSSSNSFMGVMSNIESIKLKLQIIRNLLVAEHSYKYIELCGYEWYTFYPLYYNVTNKNNEPQTIPFAWNMYSQQGSLSYKRYMEFVNKKIDIKDLEDNQNLREYYYDGVEYEDNSPDACNDPTRDGAKQRYYYRGNQSTNYACERYYVPPVDQNAEAYSKAYQCCLERSKKGTLCLRYNTHDYDNRSKERYKVCSNGEICGINIPRLGSDEYGSAEIALDGFITLFTSMLMIGNTLLNKLAGPTSVPASGGAILAGALELFSLITNLIQMGTKNDFGTIRIQVQYYIYPHSNSPSKICARTVNLCPFNHHVSGGAEYGVRDRIGRLAACVECKDNDLTGDTVDENGIKKIAAYECHDPEKTDPTQGRFEPSPIYGQCLNYCQMDRHCVDTGQPSYPKVITAKYPVYYSRACIDQVGDSINYKGYTNQLSLAALTGRSDLSQNIDKIVVTPAEVADFSTISFKQKRSVFSPFVQCFSETVRNFTSGKVGHLVCADDSYGSSASDCNSRAGGIKLREGDNAPDSILHNLNRAFRNIFILVLIIALIIFGYNVLLQQANFIDIIPFLLKMALFGYFIIGTGWQKYAFDLVYATHNYASKISQSIVYSGEVKIAEQNNIHSVKNDGCNFFYDEAAEAYRINGKSVLAFWDMLDCKIGMYLGGTGLHILSSIVVSAIILLMQTTFLYHLFFFSLMSLTFVFFLILFGIRATQIYLHSCLYICIYILVSPIVFVISMLPKFQKTFGQWLSGLISYCVQPLALFAGLTFFLAMMDFFVIGDATFDGDAPTKTLSCNNVVCALEKLDGKDSSVTEVKRIGGCQEGETLIRKEEASSSIICSFRRMGMIDDDKGWLSPSNGIASNVIGMLKVTFHSGGIAIAQTSQLLGDFFTATSSASKVYSIVMDLLETIIVLLVLFAFIDVIPQMANEIFQTNLSSGIDIDLSKAFGLKQKAESLIEKTSVPLKAGLILGKQYVMDKIPRGTGQPTEPETEPTPSIKDTAKIDTGNGEANNDLHATPLDENNPGTSNKNDPNNSIHAEALDEDSLNTNNNTPSIHAEPLDEDNLNTNNNTPSIHAEPLDEDNPANGNTTPSMNAEPLNEDNPNTNNSIPSIHAEPLNEDE